VKRRYPTTQGSDVHQLFTARGQRLRLSPPTATPTAAGIADDPAAALRTAFGRLDYSGKPAPATTPTATDVACDRPVSVTMPERRVDGAT
jgi:hypothetical protein